MPGGRTLHCGILPDMLLLWCFVFGMVLTLSDLSIVEFSIAEHLPDVKTGHRSKIRETRADDYCLWFPFR